MKYLYNGGPEHVDINPADVLEVSISEKKNDSLTSLGMLCEIQQEIQSRNIINYSFCRLFPASGCSKFLPT